MKMKLAGDRKQKMVKLFPKTSKRKVKSFKINIDAMVDTASKNENNIRFTRNGIYLTILKIGCHNENEHQHFD